MAALKYKGSDVRPLNESYILIGGYISSNQSNKALYDDVSGEKKKKKKKMRPKRHVRFKRKKRAIDLNLLSKKHRKEFRQAPHRWLP